MIVQFIHAGGTAQFKSPTTAFDTDAATDMVECTSGDASGKQYIDGVDDATSTLKYFDDNTTNGTSLIAATEDGKSGTVLFGPQGTAAGKPKYGFAAWTKNQKYNIPYDKALDLEVQFQKTDAWLFRPSLGSVWP